MATTSGQAGWNLCGRSAAGPASPDFGCGGHGPSFLGIAPDPASLVLEDRVCAPPLLQRIAMVGGAFTVLRREVLEGTWKARKGARSATNRIAVSHVAHPQACSGREGGLAEPGNKLQRSTSSSPQGSAVTKPTHRRVTSCTVLEKLNGRNNVTILLRAFTSLAPVASVGLPRCGRGIHRLMGPMPSPPPLCWHLRI